MTNDKHPLSQEEFNDVYSKVPRLAVEIVIINAKNSVYLTKRAIEPCKGQWHLPGGTVRFGETMIDAVIRIARRELNISVTKAINVGYIEYPSHFEKGMDSPVGIVFEVKSYNGSLQKNEEASNSDWFNTIPAGMHADQDVFLLENKYLHS
jgi:ADP-ribose pyrophosphatase YjhB (NUDIX family)